MQSFLPLLRIKSQFLGWPSDLPPVAIKIELNTEGDRRCGEM
jgi:hypothetical protein